MTPMTGTSYIHNPSGYYIPTPLLDDGALENSRESRRSVGAGSAQAGGGIIDDGDLYGVRCCLPLEKSISGTGGLEGLGGSLDVVRDGGVVLDAPEGDLY